MTGRMEVKNCCFYDGPSLMDQTALMECQAALIISRPGIRATVLHVGTERQ